jgi:hypothetical protein
LPPLNLYVLAIIILLSDAARGVAGWHANLCEVGTKVIALCGGRALSDYTIQKESISSFAFVGGIQMFKKVLTGGLITFEDESSEIIGQLKTKIQDKGQMVEE